jgi:hypothetical protein
MLKDLLEMNEFLVATAAVVPDIAYGASCGGRGVGAGFECGRYLVSREG